MDGPVCKPDKQTSERPMNLRRKSSKVFRWGAQVDQTIDSRLIRYHVSWIATQLAERLQQRQVGLIKVWKVCSSYLWDGNVPGDVTAAHHSLLCPPRTLPPPPSFHSTWIFKREAQVSAAHTQHGLATPATGEDKQSIDVHALLLLRPETLGYKFRINLFEWN